MRSPKHRFQAPLFVALGLVFLALGIVLLPAVAQKSEHGKPWKEPAARPIIWRNPENISARDRRYGPGSPEKAPLAPFTFIEEDKGGESPKFRVRDGTNDLNKIAGNS